MTVDDIKAMQDDFITPATAASVMKMDAGRLIGYARGGQLPFPVVISGNRVKIPRAGFLKFLGVEIEEHQRKDGIEEQLRRIADALELIEHMFPFLIEQGRLAALEDVIDQLKEAAQ